MDSAEDTPPRGALIEAAADLAHRILDDPVARDLHGQMYVLFRIRHKVAPIVFE
jgi:hypothetical protein